uniref:Putative resolvase n=1 Tax=Arthrobacter rhombi TaxID=71253 RepID=G8DC60_9MICC|nr:recombinase family protein [Arthrobacter rhombi]AER68060.1 putative resolvase [Arthrobacter rhombi]
MTTADTPLRIIGYVRVSTDKQDISPEVQIQELRAEAARMDYELTIVREDAASAATVSKRPLMVQALADLKAGKYHGLMVSKLDRLSRNMEDGTRLLADSQRQDWRIICLDLGVDTATIMGAGMYNMALNFAEIERKFIGKRTKDAMAKIKETKHVGRPRALPAETSAQVVQLRDSGLTMKAVAERLKADGVPSASGQPDWSVAKVQSALKSLTAKGAYKG